jgi:alkyl sulfatase BDS1-like metallo-beta-lactamase superfamily hydrolase
VWGHDNIVNFMKKQRDLYKYMHDQSLHLMNQGYTMNEVAERLRLPASLSQEWFNRGYYGTVNHNAKAVYQKYLGWFDSNPANLHRLPPRQSARRYVEYMGGSAAVIAKARQAFDAGEYRWVAEVVNQVVFAEPHNRAARELQADALEQLGYQSESGTWRNHYLSAAYELRYGVPPPPSTASGSDQYTAMTLDLYFDYLGILLDGPKADGTTIVLNWNVVKADQSLDDYVMTLENSALTYTGPGRQSPGADATLRMARATLDDINTGKLTWAQAIQSGQVIIDNPAKLFELLSLMEGFEPMFDIVTP